MLKRELKEGWRLRAVGELADVPLEVRGRWIEARVPGCVHTDLLRAELIPDPHIGTNESLLAWIGRTDWEYVTEFDGAPELLAQRRVDLVCQGLDTVARIQLNGQTIGESADMHICCRFDVRAALKARGNILSIVFESPVRYARAMADRLGPLPYLMTEAPFNFIRKMACNFGWDWGPALTTSGIWRPIGLEGWSGVRMAGVRPSVRLTGDRSATVTARVFLQRTEGNDEPVRAVLSRGGREIAVGDGSGGESCDISLDVADPELWWPRGQGAQPLYDLAVQAGQDCWTGRVGLRSVELDTSPDSIGAKFQLKINGRAIYCKGFNWIPDDCFLDRATEPARYRRRLTQALEANANMLRVWGGGIFETDDFYDACDELGLMVWQDFLFACAMYPEEEPIRSLVEREARDNIVRLSRHPSLVLWNGCNENIWGYWDWSSNGKPWRECAKGRTWGTGYYFDLLPRVVAELDPDRPYWAASPWSGDTNVETGIYPNADTHGNMHIWDVWNSRPAAVYRQYRPRFASEFGWQAPPTYATMIRGGMIDPANPSDETVAWKLHQRHPHGQRQNMERLADWFAVPPDFDDRVYLMQVAQARAVQLAVEWQRSLRPRCTGSLYWQLNDCWPVCSWSAVDGDGRLKPLWYATRRFFAPMLATIQPSGADYRPGDPLELCLINDTVKAHRLPLSIARLTFGGTILVRQELDAELPAFGVGRYPLDVRICTPADATCEMIVVGPPTVATWFFLPDRELRYPAPEFDAVLDGARLTLTARSLLRDVCVFADRLDPAATVSDQLITLLAGEVGGFKIVSNRALDREMLVSRPVLQCVNRFGRGA